MEVRSSTICATSSNVEPIRAATRQAPQYSTVRSLKFLAAAAVPMKEKIKVLADAALSPELGKIMIEEGEKIPAEEILQLVKEEENMIPELRAVLLGNSVGEISHEDRVSLLQNSVNLPLESRRFVLEKSISQMSIEERITFLRLDFSTQEKFSLAIGEFCTEECSETQTSCFAEKLAVLDQRYSKCAEISRYLTDSSKKSDLGILSEIRDMLFALKMLKQATKYFMEQVK